MSTKSFFTKSLITLTIISASYTAFANTSLTIYTSQPNEDIQQTVSAFNEVHPDIEVKWVRDGTTKLMARYQAEQAAGAKSPDLLLIADSMTMESLVQQDMLHAYQSPNADSFSKELYSADGYYYGTKLITTGIGYNTQAPEQPQSWSDLTKDNYKNLTVMPSPLYSGAAVIHMATLTDHPDLGWDYYEQLNTNGVAAQGGNGGVLTAIASGSKAYGVIVDYMVMREKPKVLQSSSYSQLKGQYGN
ncbi:ABC transporter substrate binding protein [Vibrio variabilis]|uniref:ABC transporter substrate binding protein n=1 Tax=Vibrio variabilis TaxID=990271 RepID=A0ABQ0JHJ6_9VIBR|nr:ABC transporter substrate binding protein [Vibrio variabilis]